MKATDLSPRARQLLKVLVECYIAEGDPVGSKTLAACRGVSVSSATVRNIMVELEGLGLVSSPHTSAGRVPTVDAFRFFVDHLLEPVPIKDEWQEKVRHCFSNCQNERDLICAVAHVFAELTHAAGLVTINARAQAMIRKIEFLQHAEDRVLVLLVSSDANVQHGIVTLEKPVSMEALHAAESWAQQTWEGKSIVSVMASFSNEAANAAQRSERKAASSAATVIRPLVSKPTDEAVAAATLATKLFSRFLQKLQQEQEFFVTGQANLISQIEGEDLVHLERLYRALDARQTIIPQVQAVAEEADVRVLLGKETGEVGDTFGLITSCYGDSGAAGGHLALLGPIRMPYAHFVPFVGWVAKILGAALNTP